ncbi:hypothetical protein CLOSTMETH_02349 [[Clostridium] methylpentosum DSM 5476]|uniref:Uncharacterized protein n=1 Tax=[Clostridium] methylpentosum DSM 5476 TaxID=537013 RepID=C0EER0_9FIRM|nr:hypothetical protein CLOSTMETH_02349 [[Clostridium] methylpentosum DSM 5476]
MSFTSILQDSHQVVKSHSLKIKKLFRRSNFLYILALTHKKGRRASTRQPLFTESY